MMVLLLQWSLGIAFHILLIFSHTMIVSLVECDSLIGSNLHSFVYDATGLDRDLNIVELLEDHHFKVSY